jgi:SAM-dependent methyltransferase
LWHDPFNLRTKGSRSGDQVNVPKQFSFSRYLAAKKSVDDRALNQHVWEALVRNLPQPVPGAPLRVLEIGAGIGTMLERMLEWELLSYADYTAIDSQSESIAHVRQRLPSWADAHGYSCQEGHPNNWMLERQMHRIEARFEACDLFKFITRETGRRKWDLLVAHAFLDLMDIPNTLKQLTRLLVPSGLVYFTINFDGATILEPELDPELDERIQKLYHQTMDQRITDGRFSGDSRAGRHLFEHLKHSGIQVLDAGASDWVVFPEAQGYPEDQAYFLHFIIDTIRQALSGHPEVNSRRFVEWVNERHAQVERAQLVYIAHQLDFLGKAAQVDSVPQSNQQ